jgi:hypothetical protein
MSDLKIWRLELNDFERMTVRYLLFLALFNEPECYQKEELDVMRKYYDQLEPDE